MEYLGAWGTLIHEKNLKSKISCQTPCKPYDKKLNCTSISQRFTVLMKTATQLKNTSKQHLLLQTRLMNYELLAL